MYVPTGHVRKVTGRPILACACSTQVVGTFYRSILSTLGSIFQYLYFDFLPTRTRSLDFLSLCSALCSLSLISFPFFLFGFLCIWQLLVGYNFSFRKNIHFEKLYRGIQWIYSIQHGLNSNNAQHTLIRAFNQFESRNSEGGDSEDGGNDKEQSGSTF